MKKFLQRLLLLALLAAAVACGDEPEPAVNNDDVPNAPDVESELEKDALWWVSSEHLYVSEPALGDNGEVYFGAWDGKLYALDAHGEQMWSVETGAKIDAAPAVAADGTVITGSWDAKVYAVAPDGAKRWTFEADGPIDTSPSVDPDRRVYVASDAGTLYRLGPDGAVDWEVTLPAAATTSASIFEGPEGLKVFIGTADNAVHCISEGQIDATATVEGQPRDDIALDASGSAYVGTTTGHFHKIGADCSVKFDANLTYAVSSSPTLDAQGSAYIGAHNEQIYRLDTADGAKQWASSTGRRAPILTPPTIGEDGKLYSGANGLIAITSDGDVSSLSDIDVLTSPLIGNGAVYVRTESGHLVRLDLDLSSVADSDWPIQHGNPRRTGYLAP